MGGWVALVSCAPHYAKLSPSASPYIETVPRHGVDHNVRVIQGIAVGLCSGEPCNVPVGLGWVGSEAAMYGVEQGHWQLVDSDRARVEKLSYV